MGRKWTNMKFNLVEPDENVREASSKPKSREEVFYKYLREEFGLEDKENVKVAENIDLMFGRLSEEDIKQKVEKVFKEFKFVDKAAAIFVTDSAHIGYGWLLTKNENNSAEIEEYYKGYEGAQGNDVAGRISEDSNIRISPEWFWD